MSNDKNSLINFPELPESIDNALKNLSDAPTKEMGKTFSDIWFLIFGGISHAADKRRMKYAHDIECYHNELSAEISKIPADKKIEPDLQVTAQALENSKYCVESKELRKLFVNLISKSMNSDYSATVHPSFAEIIKQMSPDDARILQTIPLKNPIPIVDYIVEDKRTHAYITELSNVYISKLSDMDIFRECASMSSLERLGILRIDGESSISDEHAYDVYMQTAFFKKLHDDTFRFSPSKNTTLRRYLGQLTPLGQNFVTTCVL